MDFPTSDTIRDALISKAEAFCTRNKTSFSAICNSVGIDNKFLARVKSGENFNIATYQKVMDWLEAAEREHAA